jgi:hypothetical protein
MPDLFAAGVIELIAMERDSKHIVREWNREIEADIRRFTAHQQDRWGKIVIWTVLEVIWLVAVFAILGLVTRLH